MFDELFGTLKTIIIAVVIIVLVLVGVVVIWLVWDAKKTEERNRIRAVEEAKKQRIRQDIESKKKRIYLEGLRKIYDHRSTTDLEKIHSYLTIMHYNDYVPGFDKECTKGTVHAYHEALGKLMKLLGNPAPYWQYLLNDGTIGYTDRCLYVTDDMNYVYQLLQTRK